VQLTVATLPCVRWEIPRTKSEARGPRKGHMRLRTETPSVVFGHDRVAAIMVCPVRIWSVSREAWRTGSPYLRRGARQRACGFLWARCRRFASRPPTLVEDRLEAYSIKIRPTDLCHPTNLSTCTRARGSRPTFDSGVEAEP